MHGNPPRDSHANCTNFICADPDSGGFVISFRLDTKLFERFYGSFLEPPHIAMQSEFECVEVEDWVHNELAWTVIGNVATPVGVMDLNAGGFEDFGCGKEVRLCGSSP
jgi:hypothetical protein